MTLHIRGAIEVNKNIYGACLRELIRQIESILSGKRPLTRQQRRREDKFKGEQILELLNAKPSENKEFPCVFKTLTSQDICPTSRAKVNYEIHSRSKLNSSYDAIDAIFFFFFKQKNLYLTSLPRRDQDIKDH